jgi:hypothetical protein
MTSIAEVAGAIEGLLRGSAEGASRSSGFVRRESKLTGSVFAQTVVLGWLEKPEASLSELSQVAAGLGVGITPQGLDERFSESAAELLKVLLDQAIGELITADSVAIPILGRFASVAVDDSTVVALPDALAGIWQGTGERTGHNQAALKLQVRFDLLRGTLVGPLLQSGRMQDCNSPLQSTALPAGALRLADLGYFSLDVMAAEQAAGVYWLSRLQAQTVLFDDSGERVELRRLLSTLATNTIDRPVRIGAKHRLLGRLLACRVPREVAEQRRRKLRAEARHRGQDVSEARLALADWTILVTNAPVELLSLDDALVLARARWQIELLFKLWKSHGEIGHSRSHKRWRILCEIYAKLLAMVLQHWLLLLSCWSHPDRSLVKATATVRSYSALLIAAFGRCFPLPTALQFIQDTIASGCRMNTRRRAPNSYQLLLNPTAYA